MQNMPVEARVGVRHPIKGYDDQYILPGEVAYVVQTHADWQNERTRARGLPVRVRVRCPATGADMWVEEELLHLLYDTARF